MLNGAGVQSLRLLLADPRMDPNEVDWAAQRELAASAGVIVRLADALSARRETLPPRFAARASTACAGAQRALEIVDRLGARCSELGMPHAFLRTSERYPDGGAVTLLIAAPNMPAIDRAVLRDLPATPRHGEGGVRRRITGVSSYVTAHGIPLRIRHGRLGRFGEHARYARLLIDRAAPARAGQLTLRAPAPEDHLLLLTIGAAYARPAFRLDDLAWTIPVLRARSLSWDYLFATALSIGMLDAMSAFLRYVNNVHRELFAHDVLEAPVLSRFEPVPPSRRYLRHIGATLESGRWHSAARLSLLPLVAALARGRVGARRSS